MVVADGRLYWFFDAYTTSASYPYSTPIGPVNYIRNSVKFVIDAYDGTTTAYLADAQDPIAATYARIFPRITSYNVCYTKLLRILAEEWCAL